MFTFSFTFATSASFSRRIFVEASSFPCKLATFAFFGDEEEAFQKLRTGFKADVAHPCSQSVVKWRDAGLLKPLDTSRIPEWDNILPGIKATRVIADAAVAADPA